MAEYLIQDTTLSDIADAIRAKEESTGTIQVNKFASRIAAISTGIEVQTVSGTFKTSSSGTATVTCGFRPDVVSISLGETSDDNDVYAVAIPFLEYSGKTLDIAMWGDGGYVYDFYVTSSATGFSVSSTRLWDNNWEAETVKQVTFTYKAYKFT